MKLGSELHDSLMLDSILPLSTSITLVGSKVGNHELPDSDIDLIVIGNQPKILRELILEANQHISGNDRPKLDLKTYTQQDFVKRASQKENFFFWTCSQQRKVLYGMDLLDKIELIPQSVDNLIWKQIENLQESIEWSEMNTRYSGSCYYIYEYLTTSYFLKKFLFESRKTKSQRKGEFIKHILNDKYGIVRQRYYHVVKNEEPFKTLGVAKIKIDLDKKVKSEDYYELQLMIERILNMAEEMKKRFGRWADSLE